MRAVETEKSIRQIVRSSVEAYAMDLKHDILEKLIIQMEQLI